MNTSDTRGERRTTNRRVLPEGRRATSRFPLKEQRASSYFSRRMGADRRAPRPAEPDTEICELRLCESTRLILQAGKLYRFTEDPTCPACVALAEEYRR